MLTEDEQRRIREEEIFRSEVQQQLKRDTLSNKKTLKLWRALNTPFVLWLLSSLLLGSLSWVYSYLYTRNQQRQERAELHQKLDEELQFRMDIALSALEGMKKEIEQGNKFYSPAQIYSIVLKKLDGIGEERNVIYLEFRERGLQSLIRQIYYLDPSFFTYHSNAYDEIKSRSYGQVSEKTGNISKEEADLSLHAIDEAETFVRGICPFTNGGTVSG